MKTKNDNYQKSKTTFIFNYLMPSINSDKQFSLFPRSESCVLNYKYSLDDLYLDYFSYIVVGVTHCLLKESRMNVIQLYLQFKMYRKSLPTKD